MLSERSEFIECFEKIGFRPPSTGRILKITSSKRAFSFFEALGVVAVDEVVDGVVEGQPDCYV